VSIGDYLPLKVGSKYLYEYDGSTSFHSTDDIYSKSGECQWEFTEITPGVTNVYNVKMIFNGVMVHSRYHNPNYIEYLDTTLIKNQEYTLTFQENENGKIKITFPVMSIGYREMILERFLESSKIDTCFDQNLCLSLNIGIKYLRYTEHHNNFYSTSFTLLRGPY
jgi:hypothetical protein